jgi:aspartyl-tRNA(Asn)/glutamyl-tRNA(Gln) amidotransferase subunit C
MPEQPIAAADVLAIAKLARLGLTEPEQRSAAAELAGILAHFRALQGVDTQGVEPLLHTLETPGVPAADVVVPCADARERLLSLTAHAREGFLVVPRVLEADFGPGTAPAGREPAE